MFFLVALINCSVLMLDNIFRLNSFKLSKKLIASNVISYKYLNCNGHYSGVIVVNDVSVCAVVLQPQR
jgi:hypothetical protein